MSIPLNCWNISLISNRHSPRSQRVLANLEILVQQGIRPDRIDIVKLLLLASKVKKSAIRNQERLIGSAQVLLGENASLHLQVEVVQQGSTSMRLNGNTEDSIHLIKEFISRDPSTPAELMGSLHLSSKELCMQLLLLRSAQGGKEILAGFHRRKPRAAVGSCLLCWPHHER